MPNLPYRDELLQPGYFVGLRFVEGTIFFAIESREESVLLQHFNADAKQAVNTDNGFITPVDSNGRQLLEPDRSDKIMQIFTGTTPWNSRVYVNYPSGKQTMNLRGTRSVGGEWGYWSGYESPLTNPSPKTEVWTLKDVFPDYDIFLPPSVRYTQYCYLEHRVASYKYGVVQDKNLITDFVTNRRRVKKFVVGSVDSPANAPSFLGQYIDLMGTTLDIEAQAFGTVPVQYV